MRQHHTPQSRCRFGLAQADITPPVGIYHRMWGAAQHDRSEGVHRPLTATAMVFAPCDGETADNKILIALDHCLFGYREVQSMIDKIVLGSGAARDHISITFSHTHAAGLLNLDRQSLPGGELIADYLQQTCETLERISAEACSNLAETSFVYGTGRCDLAAHRDYFDEQHDGYVCGFNPEGRADNTVLVARATRTDGTPVCTLVNYACHPTTLAWDNRLISPDYPGAMRETIEHETRVPCVFLQGASGELGPVHGFVGDVDVCDRNGRQLGFSALSALESLPPAGTVFQYAGPVVSGATIGTWKNVPLDEPQSARCKVWSSNNDAVPLRYRDGLPKASDVEAKFQRLSEEEQDARETGDESRAEQLRALAEREKRMLGRLDGMPPGDTYPFHANVWRMGDAIWIAVQGEPYSQLQTELRTMFPKTPIIVSTISNGWGPSYIPPKDLYGKGIYQESIASLAPGSLETLIAALADRIKELLNS